MSRPATYVEPMHAQSVTTLPEGDDWLYEVKLDGYRVIAIKNAERVELRSRNNKDLTAAYPGVATAVANVRAQSAVLDGEIVAVDERGHPSFQALQHRSSHPQHTIACYVFDLLHVDGRDLTRSPLEQRRERLRTIVKGSGLLLSEALPGAAQEVVSAVGRLGLEGIVAKRRDSLYHPGVRSDVWRKLKLDKQQEFVVGGYRPNGRSVDALVVGYYEGRRLYCAGKVRAGLTPRLRAILFDRLKPLHVARCPFVNLPNSRTSHWGSGITAEQMAELQWVRPTLVVQIRFVEWTADGNLRHAAFLGVRDDKPARDVHRE